MSRRPLLLFCSKHPPWRICHCNVCSHTRPYTPLDDERANEATKIERPERRKGARGTATPSQQHRDAVALEAGTGREAPEEARAPRRRREHSGPRRRPDSRPRKLKKSRTSHTSRERRKGRPRRASGNGTGRRRGTLPRGHRGPARLALQGPTGQTHTKQHRNRRALDTRPATTTPKPGDHRQPRLAGPAAGPRPAARGGRAQSGQAAP